MRGTGLLPSKSTYKRRARDTNASIDDQVSNYLMNAYNTDPVSAVILGDDDFTAYVALNGMTDLKMDERM